MTFDQLQEMVDRRAQDGTMKMLRDDIEHDLQTLASNHMKRTRNLIKEHEAVAEACGGTIMLKTAVDWFTQLAVQLNVPPSDLIMMVGSSLSCAEEKVQPGNIQ